MAWIDDLATTLGEEPLSDEDVSQLLSLAREVAHRVERKITPLSTFVIGAAVARRTANGTASRAEALAEVNAAVTAMLPEAPASENA